MEVASMDWIIPYCIVDEKVFRDEMRPISRCAWVREAIGCRKIGGILCFFQKKCRPTRQVLRGLLILVAICGVGRYIGCRKWEKNLQGPEMGPIFAPSKIQ